MVGSLGGSTYRFLRQRVDGIRPDDELFRKDGVCGGVEVGTLREFEERRVALDQIVGSSVVQAGRSTTASTTPAVSRGIRRNSTCSKGKEGSDECETHVD